MRVLGAFLILANTMGVFRSPCREMHTDIIELGLQSSFGVFQAFYEENLLKEYPSSIISWIGTFQIFCTASGSLISGPLFDLEFDKFAVLLGCFFAVFGYMMTSLSTAYYQIFLAQGVAGGLAGAFVFAPCVALTAVSFQRRRSFAVGLSTSGFVVGAVIYPIVTTFASKAIGTSISLAVYIFAIANAANLVARFTATLIADWFGIIEMLTCSTFVSAVIAFCWPAVSSTASTNYCLVDILGLFSGIMSALFAAVVPSLSPTSSVVGTRLGMLNGLFVN